MSYTNDRASAELNKAAAHETSLYDESRNDNHIVAMYDTDAAANGAKDMLVAHGVSAATIQMISRNSDAGTLGGVNAEDAGGGVWGAIRSLFVPDSDRNAYTHAVGRGHAMLVITPGGGVDRAALVRAIDQTHPVDFDAKLEEWRQAGYDTTEPHHEYVAGTDGMPPAMDSPVAAMADRDPVVQGEMPPPMHPRTVTVRSAAEGQVLADPTTGMPRTQTNF